MEGHAFRDYLTKLNIRRTHQAIGLFVPIQLSTNLSLRYCLTTLALCAGIPSCRKTSFSEYLVEHFPTLAINY
jgi:hypothetical protein